MERWSRFRGHQTERIQEEHQPKLFGEKTVIDGSAVPSLADGPDGESHDGEKKSALEAEKQEVRRVITVRGARFRVSLVVEQEDCQTRGQSCEEVVAEVGYAIATGVSDRQLVGPLEVVLVGRYHRRKRILVLAGRAFCRFSRSTSGPQLGEILMRGRSPLARR